MQATAHRVMCRKEVVMASHCFLGDVPSVYQQFKVLEYEIWGAAARLRP